MCMSGDGISVLLVYRCWLICTILGTGLFSTYAVQGARKTAICVTAFFGRTAFLSNGNIIVFIVVFRHFLENAVPRKPEANIRTAKNCCREGLGPLLVMKVPAGMLPSAWGSGSLSPPAFSGVQSSSGH